MYLKKRLETIFHTAIRKTGYDVVKSKYSRHELEVEQLLKYFNITSVLDVGANMGQWAKHLRIGGYRNRIISFEPLSVAFAKLSTLAANDPKWDVYNMAIGDKNGKAEINISENLVSSSILNMEKVHLDAAPTSSFIGKQEVEVRTIDSLFDNLNIKGQNNFMKIDTQGFEKNVLDGAVDSLKHIDTLQLEMSVITLYKGEMLYYQLSDFLYSKGYRLIKIVRGHTKENGELMQFDGVFRRN
jgi:FkbM family methyltransferase